ncbi:unnamed protein product [Paramecium pentaurelia]|uniref:Uncharacterized protein n=1 Tax=Paramecium pentaurelia TaxID=43138 RepID=A0A8S1X385_9CILI|nr:unnamed protein product [Paramecium pentaurelia]
MQLKTKLLLTQLMLQNLISLIQAGNQESKDMIILIVNAIGIILNLIIFCLIYSKQREDIINSIVQFHIIFQLEIIFYNVHTINTYFLFIYLLAIENILKNNNKCYQILTHLLCLYISVRMTIQFYSEFATFEFILFVLWQPLNHAFLYLDKLTQEKTPMIPNTPSQKTSANPQAHLSYGDQFQQDLLEEKSPHPEKNVNVTLDEDLLNCLPYGLALIDKNYHVLHHNEKLLNYLMVKSTEQIVNSLDQLLSNAELNSFKTHLHAKHKPPIVPLRKLKQSSANHYQVGSGRTLNQTNWLSDRLKVNLKNKESFQSSIHDEVTYQYVQFVMNEFQQNIHRQMSNGQDSQSKASETTHMFQFHVVQDLKTKKKHYQIKVYEVKLQAKTKEPVYLFVIENITNKEELKELTFRYKFQQALLNSFSHELRTPLNCSLPLLQVLSKKIDEHLYFTLLLPAITSSKRLLLQINDILDYAQIECQDFKLNLDNFFVSEIFNDLKELFQSECQQKQIELILNFNNQLNICSDKLRITQILVNLLNNSVKFTKQGGRIVLSVKKRDNQYVFSVWDNGEGISNDQMLNMQNQLLQQNGSNKLGLGLRVSRGIVKFLSGDGELQIKSQKGFYTVVSFSIDEQVKTGIQEIGSSLKDIEEIKSNSKDSIQKVYVSSKKFLNQQCKCPQILIVDDVPFNHIALLALLQAYEWKAESSYDGDSAIRKVKLKLQNTCCRVYRIIFMDIEMPGKNGFVVSSEISEILRKEGQNTVIVMCSAYNGQENAEKAHESGMHEIVSKPISLDSLQMLLGKYFC